eukprot:TRINITY_DN46259_c0_g1_i1.p1 TRINITY_DN46259_c0_g1~~TRINITY_DN46259_c0_g1_i1.p1  ORF type:complete len:303 (+),score=94.63 TRINITY_DN46259_c0_g1_i1:58-966(+)
MPEDADAMEARHEAEEEELREKGAAHVEEARKKAGKGKKAAAAIDAAERELERWLYELHERHEQELQDRASAPGGGSTAPEPPSEPPTEASKEAEVTEEERARRKKEKSQRKRDNRSKREEEREQEKERERLEAGPSARELELAAIAARLARLKPPQRVFEVAADGNCLYHAVGDQLRRAGYQLRSGSSSTFQEVRSLCADFLRRSPEEYAPFAELADGEDYDGYCNRVEQSADWGGELELRALADGLGAQIVVHRAEAAEPLMLGSDRNGALPPLQVAYHRHYYALGEHYNSVVPLEAVAA